MSSNNLLKDTVWVALGGAVGGGLRFLLGQIPLIGSLPWMTMLINWLGAFCLAFLGTYLSENDSPFKPWESVIGTGVLGGFTTFSTMILNYYQESLWVGIIYLLATVVGGMIMVRIGQQSAHKVGGQHV